MGVFGGWIDCGQRAKPIAAAVVSVGLLAFFLLRRAQERPERARSSTIQTTPVSRIPPPPHNFRWTPRPQLSLPPTPRQSVPLPGQRPFLAMPSLFLVWPDLLPDPALERSNSTPRKPLNRNRLFMIHVRP